MRLRQFPNQTHPDVEFSAEELVLLELELTELVTLRLGDAFLGGNGGAALDDDDDGIQG